MEDEERRSRPVSTAQARSAASLAARALGLRRAKLAGSKELARIGSMGAKMYWDRLSDDERRLEMRRRQTVRKQNRRRRIAKATEKA